MNCVIAGNYNQKGLGGTAQNAAGTAACYSHCAIPEGYGTACVTGDPFFRDVVRSDFHLTPRSPGINAGVSRDWMAGAVDLDGHPRIYKPELRRSAPDIGCYESTFGTTGFMLILR